MGIPRVLRVVISLLVIAIFIYAVFNTKENSNLEKSVIEKKIKYDHKVVCATILNVTLGNSDTIGVEHFLFDYIYNNSIIKSSQPCKSITTTKFDSGTHYIFVAVLKSDPTLCIPLEDSSDYLRLNITEQDTVGIKCQD